MGSAWEAAPTLEAHPEMTTFIGSLDPSETYTGKLNHPLSRLIKKHQALRGGSQEGAGQPNVETRLLPEFDHVDVDSQS